MNVIARKRNDMPKTSRKENTPTFETGRTLCFADVDDMARTVGFAAPTHEWDVTNGIDRLLYIHPLGTG
jgi:hypothetical protein